MWRRENVGVATKTQYFARETLGLPENGCFTLRKHCFCPQTLYPALYRGPDTQTLPENRLPPVDVTEESVKTACRP